MDEELESIFSAIDSGERELTKKEIGTIKASIKELNVYNVGSFLCWLIDRNRYIEAGEVLKRRPDPFLFDVLVRHFDQEGITDGTPIFLSRLAAKYGLTEYVEMLEPIIDLFDNKQQHHANNKKHDVEVISISTRARRIIN